MEMKNGELKGFCEFLMKQELDAKNTRMRMRFVRMAADRLKEVDEENRRLINKYAKKDGSGKPIVVINDDETETVEITDINSFKKEFSEILLEDFVIEENEERKDMLLSIKNTVLNAEGTFKGDEAVFYDRWCQIVEGISF